MTPIRGGHVTISVEREISVAAAHNQIWLQKNDQVRFHK